MAGERFVVGGLAVLIVAAAGVTQHRESDSSSHPVHTPASPTPVASSEPSVVPSTEGVRVTETERETVSSIDVASDLRETPDEELERLAHLELPRIDRADRSLTERQVADRRSIILQARERALAEVDAGFPRLFRHGSGDWDATQVDPLTGVRYEHLGWSVSERSLLGMLANNSALRRAHAAGRTGRGSFLDRFATPDQVTEWIRARGIVAFAGADGVSVPGLATRVQIDRNGLVMRSGTVGGRFRFVGVSWKARVAPGWAVVAAREDGKAFAVAQPWDAETWTLCRVFDAATGLHLQTLERPSPK